MQPTQTEAPQYNSRRERHEAEAAQAAADNTAEQPLTRRQIRAIERANVYLEGLRRMNAANIANQNISPDAPINLAAHDVTIQKGLISAYQTRVDDKNWNTINDLDKLWHDTQPTEEEATEELMTYKEDTPKLRGIKLGRFISNRIFGARQNWLDKDARRVKREHIQAMQKPNEDVRDQFGKAA